MAQFNVASFGNAFNQGIQGAQNVAQTGAIADEMKRKRAMSQMYQEHGPGLMNGDPNAFAEFARVDPMAAGQLRNQNAEYERQKFGMQVDKAQLEKIRQSTRIAAAEHAAKMSKEEAAAAKRETESALARFSGAYKQGPEAFKAYVAQNAEGLAAAGIDPQGVSYETFPSLVAAAVGAMEGLDEALDVMEKLNPPAPKPADEYQRYVQEEQTAGRQPLSRIDYAQAKKGEGISMTMPDGTTVRVGGSAQNGQMDIKSPDAMLATINGILNDPALDWSTGALSWAQAVPGTPMYRFGTRARQLSGQAFMQAFEALKGAGQITEIEGQKGTEAVGRLSTGQSPNDYRDALMELKTILETAKMRTPGSAVQTAPEAPPAPGGNVSEVDIDGVIYRVEKVE